MNNLDLNRNESLLTINGQSQKLDPLMMRLFEYFISHQEAVISRQTLSEKVWQRDCVSDDAINRGISRLRKLLGGHRHDYIMTIPKQGYSFTLPKGTCLNSVNVTQLQPTDEQVNEPIAAQIATTKVSKTSGKGLQLITLIKNKWLSNFLSKHVRVFLQV